MQTMLAFHADTDLGEVTAMQPRDQANQPTAERSHSCPYGINSISLQTLYDLSGVVYMVTRAERDYDELAEMCAFHPMV